MKMVLTCGSQAGLKEEQLEDAAERHTEIMGAAAAAAANNQPWKHLTVKVESPNVKWPSQMNGCMKKAACFYWSGWGMKSINIPAVNRLPSTDGTGPLKQLMVEH